MDAMLNSFEKGWGTNGIAKLQDADGGLGGCGGQKDRLMEAIGR